MTPDISVVVCTRNRAAALSGLFDSLVRLDLIDGPRVDVVIVDSGSTDTTKDVVTEFARNAPFPVHYVFERRRGLGTARNTGVRYSGGDILLFTDDDCVVTPDWAKQVAASYRDRSDLKIIGGRVELYNPKDAPFTIKTETKSDELRNMADARSFLLGCNFAVDRRVFDRIGLFDCRFGAGTRFFASDDADLVYRAFRSRVRVLYDPGQLLYHNHGRDKEQAEALLRGYHIGSGAMIAKHFFAGDPQPLKFMYWNFRTALMSRRQLGLWRAFKRPAFTVQGFARYICYGFGRSNT